MVVLLPRIMLLLALLSPQPFLPTRAFAANSAYAAVTAGSAEVASARREAALAASHRRHVATWIFASLGLTAFSGFWVAVYLVGRRFGHSARIIRTEEEFNRVVLQADRPVLVEFSKTWCPTCVFLGPVIDRLARKYGRQVVIAKFPLMTPYFRITCWPLLKGYRIFLFPTVILFVGGQARRRWSLRYRGSSYRRALDRAIRDMGNTAP